MTIRVPT